MVTMVTLKYLKELGQGRWEYRRRVPDVVKLALGKTEWKRVILARSDAELLRAFSRVDAEFSRDVALARAKTPEGCAQLTPRAAWEVALAQAAELASGVVGAGEHGDFPNAPGFLPDYTRELVAESFVARGGADPLLIQALMDPGKAAPSHNLQDALNVYVKEKLAGGVGHQHRGTIVRLERVMKKAREAGLPASTALSALTREQARKTRDHMLAHEKQGGGRVSPASVKREIGLLRTVIGYGIRELGLSDTASNPFEKLPIEGISGDIGAALTDREKGLPLPPKVNSAMRGKLTGDLLLIWRLLEGTGCRLAEVTGLRVADVVVQCPDRLPPHIKVRWHEGRRIKGRSSIRSVPLVGDALAAAQEALTIAVEGPALFSRYARVRGPDAASAALMKHLRGFTTDKRHKVHSLRHGMKDRLRKAGVDKIAQDIVLGHAAQNVGELYGGDEGLLSVALKALQTVERAEAT